MSDGEAAELWRPVVVAVPCFNEEDRLDLDAFERFTVSEPRTGFLFVDDGSEDGTADLIEARANEGCAFRLLRLDRNRGKGEAVRQGLRHAVAGGAELVGFWDADLATPLDELGTMLQILRGNPALDAVLGARVLLLGRRIQRHPLRHYLGRAFGTAASIVLRMPVYDTQCGAKVFRTAPELRSALERPFRSRWIFDVELIDRLNRLHDDDAHAWIEEWPIRHWCDVGGSKLRPHHFVTAAWDLLRIWSTR